MKRSLLLCAGLFCVSVSSFAIPPIVDPNLTTCAVAVKNKVKMKAATKSNLYADYKGNRYFFCCSPCPKKFWADPEKYVNNAHIPTPAP